MYNILYQSHAGSWAILLLFFVLSYIFYKKSWLMMVTRLFFLIMLISGIGMLFMLQFPIVFILKGILAVGLIGLMEMLVAKRKREAPTTVFWILFAVLLVLVVLIGFNVISF